MREKSQNEVAKTLETPVFSRGIEILTEKSKFLRSDGGLKQSERGYGGERQPEEKSQFCLWKMLILKKLALFLPKKPEWCRNARQHSPMFANF